MGSNYIFSLTPTFTQGLVLGQLSILLLLSLVLKYLFLESALSPQHNRTPYSASFSRREHALQKSEFTTVGAGPKNSASKAESADWFNLLLKQVVETYRSKLRNDLPGADGDEIARQRIERYANRIRPDSFVDPITILSVDLGSSAPQVSNARFSSTEVRSKCVDQVEFDMSYTDTISVSLTTSVLFHYPIPYFARLPITLNVSLSLFASSVTITPPDPLSTNPILTVSLPPTFTLELKITSLMGSRAKLADVPKLHEMIQARVRRIIAERGAWKINMPWLKTVEEFKEELFNETMHE